MGQGKEELASYLANLISIMDFHEDLGTTKSQTLVDEFNRTYHQLNKEIEREARQSKS